jgi:hypothetical protein
MQYAKVTEYDSSGDPRVCTVTETLPPFSSCEVTMDSKGVAKPTIKVYHTDPETAMTEAVRLYHEAVRLLSTS